MCTAPWARTTRRSPAFSAAVIVEGVVSKALQGAAAPRRHRRAVTTAHGTHLATVNDLEQCVFRVQAVPFQRVRPQRLRPFHDVAPACVAPRARARELLRAAQHDRVAGRARLRQRRRRGEPHAQCCGHCNLAQHGAGARRRRRQVVQYCCTMHMLPSVSPPADQRGVTGLQVPGLSAAATLNWW